MVKCGGREAIYNLMNEFYCFSGLENLGYDLQKCVFFPYLGVNENKTVLEWVNCPSSRMDRLCYSLFSWTVDLCCGGHSGHISKWLFRPSPYQKYKVNFLGSLPEEPGGVFGDKNP